MEQKKKKKRASSALVRAIGAVFLNSIRAFSVSAGWNLPDSQLAVSAEHTLARTTILPTPLSAQCGDGETEGEGEIYSLFFIPDDELHITL